MRGLTVALSLLLASTGQAEQIEAEIGGGLVAGMMAGNVASGTLWMGSAFKLRAQWAAFIEEDYGKRWRIGVEVPLHERIALGIRPGLDFPVRLFGLPFCIGLGLRSYVTPYTLHGVEGQVSWRPKLMGGIELDAGGSASAFFFGNDLPTNGAIIEFQASLGLRVPL
jgi:hypothetical protein